MKQRKDTLTNEQILAKKVASLFSQSERNKFKRRHEKIQELIKDVQRIEKKVMDLKTRSQPLYDEIAVIRAEMVEMCTHEPEYLVFHDDNIVECKFCNKKINVLQ